MKNIHEAVSGLLVKRLQKHKSSTLNDEACILIYQDIFDCFVNVFQESEVKISNESMNMLSQMYYDAVKVNENQELNPKIFQKRASVKNIETKELALLATMLNGTPFAEPFVYEFKRRA